MAGDTYQQWKMQALRKFTQGMPSRRFPYPKDIPHIPARGLNKKRTWLHDACSAAKNINQGFAGWSRGNAPSVGGASTREYVRQNHAKCLYVYTVYLGICAQHPTLINSEEAWNEKFTINYTHISEEDWYILPLLSPLHFPCFSISKTECHGNDKS